MVLELKDKLTKTELGTNAKENKKSTNISQENVVKEEAYEALINLGYKRSDAKSIIEKVYETDMKVEDVIKKALVR